mmetsp:Transcript_26125/g.65405  ORF Transcript_26125/g.65405 Transcript_26125/m.65405 type:complete len:211 (+) Transcript_26125:212-844(+)
MGARTWMLEMTSLPKQMQRSSNQNWNQNKVESPLPPMVPRLSQVPLPSRQGDGKKPRKCVPAGMARARRWCARRTGLPFRARSPQMSSAAPTRAAWESGIKMIKPARYAPPLASSGASGRRRWRAWTTAPCSPSGRRRRTPRGRTSSTCACPPLAAGTARRGSMRSRHLCLRPRGHGGATRGGHLCRMSPTTAGCSCSSLSRQGTEAVAC